MKYPARVSGQPQSTLHYRSSRCCRLLFKRLLIPRRYLDQKGRILLDLFPITERRGEETPYVTLLTRYHRSYKAYFCLWRFLISTDIVPPPPLAKGLPAKGSKDQDELARKTVRHNIAVHARTLGLRSDRIMEFLKEEIHDTISQYIPTG